MIEEQNLDLPAVVGVDDTSARVDEVLASKTGAGGDTAVWRETVLGKSQDYNSGTNSMWWLENRNVQVPAGQAMLMSVSTRPLPRAGMTVALEA